MDRSSKAILAGNKFVRCKKLLRFGIRMLGRTSTALDRSESMVNMKPLLSAVAIIGLLGATPAVAQYDRSSQSLPAANAKVVPVKLTRASAPASESNEFGRRSTTFAIFGGIAAIVLLIVLLGDNDSPG